MRFVFIVIFLLSFLNSSMLKDAKILFNNAKYIQAYEKFYTLHTRNKHNNYVSIFLAKTSYNIGEFDKAKKIIEPLYERSHNSEAGLLLAKIYFYEKQYLKAKKILLTITEKQYKTEVSKYLKMIKNRTNSHSFWVYASLAFTNDNNIHDDTYKFNNLFNKAEDTFVDKVLYISHRYKNPISPGIIWDDNLFLYDRSGLKYSSENISLISLRSGPTLVKDNFSIKPRIILKDMYYESENYMYDYGLGIEIDKQINKFFAANLQFSYEKNRYIQTQDKGKDSKNFSIFLGINQFVTNNDAFKYTFSYAKINKTGGNRIDVSREEYLAGINYYKKISNGYNLNLGISYKDFLYNDRDTTYTLRRDKNIIYTASLSKKIKDDFTISLQYNHINSNSNTDWYSYKKDTLSVMLSKVF